MARYQVKLCRHQAGLVPLTNLADHVIKLHLRLVTDHFFQNDEFLHSMFSVWGSRGSVQGSQLRQPSVQWRAICTKMCEMRRHCCCHGTPSILTPHPTWDWSHTDTLTLVITHPNYEIGYSQSQLHSVLPFIGSLSLTVYELSLFKSFATTCHR